MRRIRIPLECLAAQFAVDWGMFGLDSRSWRNVKGSVLVRSCKFADPAEKDLLFGRKRAVQGGHEMVLTD